MSRTSRRPIFRDRLVLLEEDLAHDRRLSLVDLETEELKRSAHRSVRALNAGIRAWIETWNANPRPYVWTKPAERIMESIARYCQRIHQTAR